MTMSNNIITEMKKAGIEIDVAPNKLRTVNSETFKLYSNKNLKFKFH